MTTAEPVIPLKQRKTLQKLNRNDCRWPIGDPQDADFHFCGKPQASGHSYCEFHWRKAFQPSKPRYAPRVVVEPAADQAA
jgi:GcrA cell cycle regulator